jgi:hypothetical protein
MSNEKVRLYIGYGMSMFGNIMFYVVCFSIICYITSHMRMHMLVFLCGLYIWNQGFDYTFCDNNGGNEMPVSFALKLWSKW